MRAPDGNPRREPDRQPRREPGPAHYMIAAVLVAVTAVAWPARPGEEAVTPPPDRIEAAPRFPQPGSVARDFALPRLSLDAPFSTTDTLRLSDYRGRYVYLDIFGSWCLPCQKKYPEMARISEQFERAGAVVIGLLLEDSPSAAASWFRDQGGLSYPFVVLDDETTRSWDLIGAPMGFLVSPDGHIERRCVGCTRGSNTIETMLELVRRRRWVTAPRDRTGD